uniref:Polyadenylate-binding protein n=1 Tax=Caenorhabditis japonica TaxID=281687 RepID=A0A8R1E002_CAEJA
MTQVTAPAGPGAPQVGAPATGQPPAAVMQQGPPVPNMGYPPNATYSMASLYIGDLHPDVTESMLFEKFSMAGPVLSIRVCRDNTSRLSLGYAYVNFQQPADAERALDTMNYEVIHNRPMRIMWSQRDPAARRAGNGNIFIKNLDRDIDNKSIYDTFSLFGNILSCKVATDEDGTSRGYGFVHFETEASAQTAIDKVNGMHISGKKVYVGKFQPRAQRMKELGDSGLKFTNVFVKNFGEHINEEKLKTMFSQFGEITSAVVMTDAQGKPKGFGFVAFTDPDNAAKAVDTLNDSNLEGTDLKLAVCRAQKKTERIADLKRKYEALKQERVQRYQGVNLYVKNIDEEMTDDGLREHFAVFGTITSAKIMVDENGRSKGFGFVCFEKPAEATAAVTDMNSKMIGAKPLYVALAQRKEDRRAQLASQYMQRLATLRMGQQQAGVAGLAQIYQEQGYFMANAIAAQGRPAFPTQAAPMRGPPGQRVFGGNQVFMQYPFGQQQQQQLQARVPYQAQQGRPQNQQNRQSYNNMGQRPQGPQQRMGVPGQMGSQMRQHQGAPRGAPQQQKPFYQGPPRQQQPQQQPQQPHVQQPPQQPHGVSSQSAIVIHGQETLTSHMLAQAAPQEQKQLLGERIYALIEKMFPNHKEAGKITGMMLEIDNAELIMLLQDNDLFRGKVEEAQAVLTTSQNGAGLSLLKN